MDPTPPATESVDNGSPAWHALERMMDTIRLHWSRFFVQYSAADQLAVVRELKAESTSARNKAFDSMSALFGSFTAMLSRMTEYGLQGTIRSLAAGLGPALIGLALLLWLGIKRPSVKGTAGKKTSQDEQLITQLYGRMISHLARKGISKPAATPPLEFVCITRDRWRDAGSAVAAITELYCRTRFGRMPLTREELALAEDHLRCLMALQKPYGEGIHE